MGNTLGLLELQSQLSVSRETLARFETYGALLQKWNKAINLVAAESLRDLWRRHFLDSAQLYALAGDTDLKIWVDLGSGAGFPGMVLAIMAAGEGRPMEMHLIESDTRKCAFLRQVALETATPVVIHDQRIEEIEPFIADVVTSRALAPLPRLLEQTAKFCGPETVCLFLKGLNLDAELTEATKCWKMSATQFPSLSDPRGKILRMKGLRHV